MAEKDKPITIGGKTYKNREEFRKFSRGIGLPKKEDAEKGKGITTISPGGDPTNRNKDGSIKRTKQIREEFAKEKSRVPKDIIKRKQDATPATKKTPKKSSPKGQAEKGASPLEGKPRSIAEAKRRGEVYFFDSKGVKKIAATAADLKRTGLSLREYANKFAPKKQTKQHAESLKGFAAKKKRGGGVMKKKGARVGGVMKKKGARVGGVMKKKMARVGGVMKKKGMAAGGRNTMKKQMMRGGGMTGMKKKMMAGGGAMKKKGYAVGGAMKKKGMKRGGKVMKMRGGGLATRGTNFTIR